MNTYILNWYIYHQIKNKKMRKMITLFVVALSMTACGNVEADGTMIEVVDTTVVVETVTPVDTVTADTIN